MTWHILVPNWTLGLLSPSKQGICTHGVSWEQFPAPLTAHLYWDLCRCHLTWDKTIPGTTVGSREEMSKCSIRGCSWSGVIYVYIYMLMLDSVPMPGKGAEIKVLVVHMWHRLIVQSGARCSWTVSFLPTAVYFSIVCLISQESWLWLLLGIKTVR